MSKIGTPTTAATVVFTNLRAGVCADTNAPPDAVADLPERLHEGGAVSFGMPLSRWREPAGFFCLVLLLPPSPTTPLCLQACPDRPCDAAAARVHRCRVVCGLLWLSAFLPYPCSKAPCHGPAVMEKCQPCYPYCFAAREPGAGGSGLLPAGKAGVPVLSESWPVMALDHCYTGGISCTPRDLPQLPAEPFPGRPGRHRDRHHPGPAPRQRMPISLHMSLLAGVCRGRRPPLWPAEVFACCPRARRSGPAFISSWLAG